MDDASKRSGSTLIMGSREAPDFDEAPTLAREPSSRNAAASSTPPMSHGASSNRPPSGARRTIRGNVPSSRPPPPSKSTHPTPAVMVDHTAYGSVSTPLSVHDSTDTPQSSAQWAPYSLPPLPPTRPLSYPDSAPKPVAQARSSTRAPLAGLTLAVALVVLTLLVALGFSRRSSPTRAIAPSATAAPSANVSLLYDGGATR